MSNSDSLKRHKVITLNTRSHGTEQGGGRRGGVTDLILVHV